MSYKNAMNLVRAINNNNHPISKYNIFKKQIYENIECKVSQNDTLVHALIRFSILDTSILAVVDSNENVVGSFSQKMYMKNISWLEGKSESVYIGDIVQSREHESIANFNTDLLTCYNKTMLYNQNDLLILDNDDLKKFGIVSTNDIIHNILNSIE